MASLYMYIDKGSKMIKLIGFTSSYFLFSFRVTVKSRFTSNKLKAIFYSVGSYLCIRLIKELLSDIHHTQI